LKLPDYVGPCAFGIKMGVIVPGCDFTGMMLDALEKVDRDELLSDGDVICITESVVARSQKNYVTTDEVAEEVQEVLSLKPHHRLGVVFPIASRNRFALVLKGLAQAVPQGEVVLQLSYPADEVGNQIISPELAQEMEKKKGTCFAAEDLNRGHAHPLTGVDYIRLYKETIESTGARPRIILCNDPRKILEYRPDAVIAADIHTREKTKAIIEPHVRCITLQELCCTSRGGREACCEWGLLGSNMSSGNRLKLAPREGDRYACDLQEQIKTKFGKEVEVVIYGDGAYKDPSSGIYELADPKPAFGVTPGINSVMRTGVKYKYLIDLHHEEGKPEEEIRSMVEKASKREREINSIESEGTTPRRLEDVLASLADLVSGSADAGTPMVLVKRIIS